MSHFHLYAVEFFGGPFDGHKHVACEEPGEWASVVALPFNTQVLERMGCDDPGPNEWVRNMAVYELENTAGIMQYRYLATVPATQLQLEHDLNQSRADVLEL